MWLKINSGVWGEITDNRFNPAKNYLLETVCIFCTETIKIFFLFRIPRTDLICVPIIAAYLPALCASNSVLMTPIIFCWRRLSSSHRTRVSSQAERTSSPAAASRCLINSLKLRRAAIIAPKRRKNKAEETEAKLTKLTAAPS